MSRRQFERTICGAGANIIPVLTRKEREPTQKTEAEITSKGAQYTLEKLLGVGGMGEVWQAECTFPAGPGTEDDVKRDVAVKFVTGVEQNSELSVRLVREAQLTARLNHENIVRFEGWDYLEKDQAYFIVMEYIKGLDIDGLMHLHHLNKLPENANGIIKMPDKIVGFMLFAVGSALAYAHTYKFKNGQIGVVHRDISPGNILIKLDEGVVKLGDFGIAATTEDLDSEEGGLIYGKVPYLSPEGVFSPNKVDGRSDLYSLGVVAYELLTGIRPNEPIRGEMTPESQLGYLYQVFTQKELIPPHEVVEGIDPQLSRIVCKLLETSLDERYQTAAELVDDVGRMYLFKKRYGPTKVGLREYINILQDGANLGMHSRDILKFLRKDIWSEVELFAPLVFNADAFSRMRHGENPARR
jgi:serine/threonine-protein kinase